MVPGIIGDGKNIDPVKVRKIYNGFTNKDMSFEDFSKSLQELTDPIKLGQDLNIELACRRGI